MTIVSYKGIIKNHIKPAIGAIKLDTLTTPVVQKFYNSLSKETDTRPPLSAKSIKNIHGILHKSLQQAVIANYIRFNPSDGCTLPRIEKKEIKPLDELETTKFLDAIKGHKYESLFFVDLFTGLRLGEILGLRWEDVDFESGTITVRQQLQRAEKRGDEYTFASLKNDKPRKITPAPVVMQTLKAHRGKQAEKQLAAGELWEYSGLVFTDDFGHFIPHHVAYKKYKSVVRSIGLPDARFHDLRHSYAVASIRAGDDIKTVQGNLGHATAAFTLDIYGHVTEQMKKASADRMQAYFETLKISKGSNQG